MKAKRSSNTQRSTRGERSTRRDINLAAGHDTANPPISDAVAVGDTLYVAGRIGLDPETGAIPADVDQELKHLFDSFAEVLKAAGMTMDHLVRVEVFCPDLSLYARFNAAYRVRFSRFLPARAFIGSGPLLLDARFEMLGIAVRS